MFVFITRSELFLNLPLPVSVRSLLVDRKWLELLDTALFH